MLSAAPNGIWPCRVSIFVVATEDAGKGCQITQLKGTPNEPIAYEKRVSPLCSTFSGAVSAPCMSGQSTELASSIRPPGSAL